MKFVDHWQLGNVLNFNEWLVIWAIMRDRFSKTCSRTMEIKQSGLVAPEDLREPKLVRSSKELVGSYEQGELGEPGC